MAEEKGPRIEMPEELRNQLGDTDVSTAEPGSTGDPAPAPGAAGDAPAEARLAPPAAGDGPAESAGDEAPAPDPEAELGALNDKHLRLAAEYENFRRRSLRERQDLLKYGNESLVRELLESADNLERALAHGAQHDLDEDARQLVEGVELTQRSFLQALEKFGVSEIEALGEPFDPAVHEAIRQMPSDQHPSGAVAEVFQKGYRLADRLLRPALVAVSTGGAEKADVET